MQKISAVEDMQELALLLSIIILAAGISRANYPPVRVTSKMPERGRTTG